MPTAHPRLNVTVTAEQHSLLLELGALQGRSAASYLREMLDAATPMLLAMLPVYRTAAAQEAMQPDALVLAIREALSGVEAHKDQLDLLAYLARPNSASANDLGAVPSPAASGASEEEVARRSARRRS